LLAMGAQDGELASPRLFIWGGDELPGVQVRQFRLLAPGADHVNLYGATETPQAAALYRIPSGDPARWRSTPIGRSVDWMQCNCVTPDGRICGPGEVGELQVTMPFPVLILSADGSLEQRTKHRTGDRAFVMPGREMVFLGRRDDQIKIRGFRVELVEVTAVLRSLPSVRQCLTLTETKDDGSLRLAAWCEADASVLTVANLRQVLRRHLPDHMIPERLTILDRMPLLANGKIDRAAVRALTAPSQANEAAMPLATETERRIARVFSRASGNPVANSGLRLIDLGADSLSVIGARLELEEIAVDLPDGWEELSIRELADRLPQIQTSGPSWLRLARIETFIAIRSVAIFLVVALHMHWFGYGGGGTHLLFLIAGLTFATYSARPIIEDGQLRQVWVFLGKIIVIGYPVMLLIFCAQLLLGKPTNLSVILFFGNLIDHGPGAPDDGRVVWLWYIHSYFQAFLFIALLLSVPKLQTIFRRDPFSTTMVAAAVLMAVFALLALWVGALTTPIAALSPMALSPLPALVLVLLGMGLGFADTPLRRNAVIGSVAIWSLLKLAFFQSPHVLTLLIGVMVLAFVPSLRLPALIVRGMTIVSGASFFVYLMHNPLAFVAERAFFITAHPAVMTIGTIAASVLLWRLWQPVVQQVFTRKTLVQDSLGTSPA
jgi:hypothetical protein